MNADLLFFRHAAALAVGAALITCPSFAVADLASAEALFREGHRLLEAGQTAEACRKFAESQREDPSPGTLLNLGSCHVKQGKTASAWAEFLASARLARAQHRDAQAEEADKRARELEPQLSYLTVTALQPVPGLTVVRNGERIDQGAFGTKIPVDPDSYVIVGTAPGYREARVEVRVDGGSDQQVATIPALEPAPAPAASAQVPPEAASGPPPSAPSSAPAEADGGGSSKRTVGFILGGVGVAALGVGATFGVLALSSYGKAGDACPTHKNCSPGSIDDRDTAQTRAWIANVGVGAGVVMVGVGAVLVLTGGASPPPARAGVTVIPEVSPTGAGASLSGRFF